mmetsp:Transcript_22887/g.29701  ORF Transcript_22887/g.29701 Transcript_22887/m.29701 type:complete len:248 (-) Transcript_22887:388-1131(-)
MKKTDSTRSVDLPTPREESKPGPAFPIKKNTLRAKLSSFIGSEKLDSSVGGSDIKIAIDDLRGTPEFALIESHLDQLDKDKDGTIDATELSIFLEKNSSLVSSVTQLRIGIFVLVLYVLAMVLVNFGLSYAALNLLKEVKTESEEGNSGMVSSDGKLLKVGTTYSESNTVSISDFFDSMTSDEYLLINKVIFREVPDGTTLRFDIDNVHLTDDEVTLVTADGRELPFQSRTFPFETTEMEVYSATEY